MNGQLQISTTTPSQKGHQKTSCTRDYVGGSYSKHHQQKIMSKTKLGLHCLRLMFPINNYTCQFCWKATIITTNTYYLFMYKPNLVFPLEFGGTLHTIIFILPSLASYRSVTCSNRRGCFFPFLLKGTPQTIIFLPSLPGII
jgi:hypothetical protein